MIRVVPDPDPDFSPIPAVPDPEGQKGTGSWIRILNSVCINI